MDIRSMTADELKKLTEEIGEKPYRAGQLFTWLHKKHAASYGEMTDLSKKLRQKLEEEYPLVTLQPVKRLISKQDGTEKYLFGLADGNVIESVLMRYHHGNSVCISSQVGCAMNCAFCASARNRLIRSLTASEMLEQVYRIEEISRERVSNVVVMGMGEPLLNYDALLRFIRLLSDSEGLCISQRNITVSTCGIVPAIFRLADEKLQITLAVSLHAASDAKRKKIMPVAETYSLEQVMEAVRYYFRETGRRISFEYALIENFNSSAEDVKELAGLIGNFPAHVNLIPVNTVKESRLARPERRRVEDFAKKLEKHGINVTIRKEMGSDINGACGQLRNSYMK